MLGVIARMVCALFGHRDWVMVMHHPLGRVFMCTRCDKAWPAPVVKQAILDSMKETDSE